LLRWRRSRASANSFSLPTRLVRGWGSRRHPSPALVAAASEAVIERRHAESTAERCQGAQLADEHLIRLPAAEHGRLHHPWVAQLARPMVSPDLASAQTGDHQSE